MKKEQKNRIITFELGYIPKGSTGSLQNKLRCHYNIFRRKGIVKGLSREECLVNAIDRLKEDHPNCDPQFDDDFFKLQEKRFFRRLLNQLKG